MKSWLALSVLALAGCMNMSGLDGETRYACAAPGGVACDSVSGTYATALRNNLPSQRGAASANGVAYADTTAPAAHSGNGPTRDGEAPPSRPKAVGAPPAAGDTAARDGKALRSPARILRLWTKPWEDADGDLWDQGHVYVQIDTGRWQLDHVHQRIRDQYLPLQPPIASPAASSPLPDTGASNEAPAQSIPRNAATSPFGTFPSPFRSPTVPGQRQP